MKKLTNLPIDVTGVIKVGGYYKWTWKFPFRHFIKEEVRVFTKNAIYLLDNKTL